ncbi:hypothetical protein [Acutalibacter caecimuris]|uniref:hypothetical protein n=1 Tax=Acutalibacter caecimuris TaxID=3093657 RepID=UPI002AC8A11A|nr:hypothetical protein [Acutalibacter sp. M00118]
MPISANLAYTIIKKNKRKKKKKINNHTRPIALPVVEQAALRDIAAGNGLKVLEGCRGTFFKKFPCPPEANQTAQPKL